MNGPQTPGLLCTICLLSKFSTSIILFTLSSTSKQTIFKEDQLCCNSLWLVLRTNAWRKHLKRKSPTTGGIQTHDLWLQGTYSTAAQPYVLNLNEIGQQCLKLLANVGRWAQKCWFVLRPSPHESNWVWQLFVIRALNEEGSMKRV